MTSDNNSQVEFTTGKRSISSLLAKYRPYLKLLASRKLDGTLGPRLSASDIVQQTQLEAFRGCGMFRGETEAQFVAWLKAILASKLAEATQTHIVTQKRSVKRERSFETGDAFDSGARDGIAVFEGKEESPSAAAMRGESAVTLAQAMEQLSERQYEAIRLRYIEGRSLSSIAESMESTEYAVAGLLKRGLVGLRGLLPGEVGQ